MLIVGICRLVIQTRAGINHVRKSRIYIKKYREQGLSKQEGLTGKASYQYDTLNRLVKVQYPKGLEEFTYDKADNRIRRLTEKEEELYRYDVCNRLTEKQTRRISDSTAGTAIKHGNSMNPENAGKTIHLEKPETMKPQGNNNTVVKRGATAGKQDNLIPFQTSTFQYDN